MFQCNKETKKATYRRKEYRRLISKYSEVRFTNLQVFFFSFLKIIFLYATNLINEKFKTNLLIKERVPCLLVKSGS